ncbi:MAG: hypothetical protein INF97_09470 [Roseomonas sp.]|nr:hypothetical protein [Roseomonas sp.]
MTQVLNFCIKGTGDDAMISQLNAPQTQVKDGLRPPAGAAGADRPAGAAPPEPSPEVGPPNPRLRIDRDLGIVVIEFRDTVGRVSVSLPTPREIDAYRASILFGAEMPPDVKAMNVTPGGPSAARPGIPLPPEPKTSLVSWLERETYSAPDLNKTA